MDKGPDTITRRGGGTAAACLFALAMTAVMTWPLAANMSRLGRTGGDALYSVWNIAWVARTIVAEPGRLFHANIFHPHPYALAYSEANLGGGLLAVPAWWLTRDPYVAHNTAVMLALATGVLGMWLLARYLTRDPFAAAVAAVMYGFCPYLFAHTAHIQLLFCGGIPLSLLALHRLADAPSARRGVLLGLALAAQALTCAYYGIFAGLMVAHASLFLAFSRGLWRDRAYIAHVALAAAISIAVVAPFFLPYVWIQGEGFHRTLNESIRYSANVQSYLTSAAHAHYWMLSVRWIARLPRFIDVLFPGFLALGLGMAGIALAFARATRASDLPRPRETALLYGSIGVLAFWASFGPAAGLYTVLFRIPVFSFLRAPARFGLLVVLVLAVFSAIALARLLAGRSARVRGAVCGVALALVAAELNMLPFPWERVVRPSPVYEMLSQMPRAPVAEFPFYGERVAYPLHTQYMLFSTSHWMPMVNGYSDHIPTTFRNDAFVLDSFPSRDAFKVLQRRRVRYIGVHWDMYVHRAPEIRQRIASFAQHLRPLAADANMTLYEIVSFP
jgi:hypothetical protein